MSDSQPKPGKPGIVKASSRHPAWIPSEIATLKQLMADHGDMDRPKAELLLLEMESGKTLTQALLGIRPVPPNHELGNDWVVVERADLWTSAKVLTITSNGFVFMPKQGIYFDNVPIMPYVKAEKVVMQAKVARPDAPYVHMYNVHTGEEIHFLEVS